MKNRNLTPESLLDEAIAALHEESPDPEVERQATARALERLRREAGATSSPAAAGPAMAAELPERIRSCGDYQALIPAYLAGELPAPRALLLADHARECVPCRKALKQARGGADRRLRRAPAAASSPHRWRVLTALAAGLLVALGAASFLYFDWGGGDDAQVRSVEGQLFRLTPTGAVALRPGDQVAEGDDVRTARDSGAMVRLADGSLVEMRERSQLSFAERRGETTIRVDRGSIIVQAAHQDHGHLYVATDDCLVSVTGTIFAVNHGTKGSRVSVIEGEVHVAQGRQETVLHPGDQVATRAAMGTVPMAREISWSRDGDRYLALLKEFKALDKQFSATLARRGLRYQSRLLGLVPAETAIYFAMPNVAPDLAELNHLFQQRVSENELLKRWWQEKAAGSGLDGQLQEIVDRIGGLGENLGDEIVVAVSLDARSKPGSPLLLAEVTHPAAFAAVLAAEVERINAAGGGPRLVLVTDPASLAPGGENQVLLWLAGDLFAVATEPARLQELAGVIADPGANPFATGAFSARLAEAYSQGAQWLLGVDVGRLLAGEENSQGAFAFTGLADVDYLVVERKADEDTVHTGAVLSFRGPRQGALAWLASPAPMGSLDFISADANFTAAFVVEDPATILGEVFRFVAATDPEFPGELERFEAEHGVDVIADLAAPLGGEIAFALDGPALPRPAWKVVAEVYDPAGLEQAIEWAVEQANQAAAAAGRPGLTLTAEDAGGRTYHRLTLGGEAMEVDYTFDGGYWIAAPSRALVDRALQIRDSGYGITDSPAFVALLPEDGYLNFSAVVFSNLGSIADTLLGAAEGISLTDEQRQAIAELDLGAPSLTCAYGEEDRIRLVATGRGGIFGSRLGTLLGLGALGGLGG
jgi:FecR protein/Putative zinc-finger